MQSLYFCLVSVYFCILHTSWFSQVNNLNTLMNMYLFNWVEINPSIYHRVNSWYWYCYRLKVLNDINIIQSNDGIVKARFGLFSCEYTVYLPRLPPYYMTITTGLSFDRNYSRFFVPKIYIYTRRLCADLMLCVG